MRMKMKSGPLYVPIVMAVMSALAVTATTWPTTGTSGLSLNGKMFTLSRDRGGISFYPPYYYPSSSTTTRPYYTTTRPYYTTTRPYYTTTRPYYTTTRPHRTTTTRPPRTTTTRHPWTTTTRAPRTTTTRHPWTTTTRHPRTTTTRHPRTTTTRAPRTTTTRAPRTTTTRHPWTTTTTDPWTTAPVTRGVSVCLRYLAEDVSSLFTLSPSSRVPLQLGVGNGGYKLTFTSYRYFSLYFQPNIRFWTNVEPDIWNRVCFTVDSVKNVAQVFSGSNISVRKILPLQYVWSGEPVMDFSGFDGQLTDVQIWDYPLSYREVFNYMTSGVYAPYGGSALSWSYISYSPRGQTLLEDTFELQGKWPISNSRGKKGRRPKGGKKTRRFYNLGESKRGQL